MIIVGLTGGIGSGKSTVARVFETLGVKIYNSDERAKELYFVPHVKIEIEKLLGKEAYVNETILNKKYISEKIFSNNELLKQVNAIIHTEVKKDSDAFVKTHANKKYIIKESALLVEAKLLSSIDKLLVVTSNINLRKQRVALRDGLSEEEINKRMAQQVPEEEKIKLADWVLENNEDDLLIPQIIKIHQSLMA
ncbi:MAG TPA: dephospho-CoA kinase [Bacteroidia bacterium]|nr:dephospho-CoA kinase [Bacteroidia bacterium]